MALPDINFGLQSELRVVSKGLMYSDLAFWHVSQGVIVSFFLASIAVGKSELQKARY